jgi:poly(hydroxyalkanoate) depolymerase family esterase
VNFRLFVPERGGASAPLFVALHGCRQDAEDFANGTRFDVLGERYGAVVLYPEQDERVNGHRCWNWFLPQNQRLDGPEPSQILQLVERIAQENAVDRDRVFVVGLSAGASMAAILAEQAPDVFAGVAAMSGVALHAAHDADSAYAAMRGQPPNHLRPEPLRESVFYRRGRAIIWTGARDLRVAPVNAWRLAAQFAHLYGLRAAPDEEDSGPGGRHARWHDRSGRTRIEVRELAAVGHAWSGGSLRGSYTAPIGPSFSEALFRFFLEEEAVGTKDSMRQCG